MTGIFNETAVRCTGRCLTVMIEMFRYVVQLIMQGEILSAIKLFIQIIVSLIYMGFQLFTKLPSDVEKFRSGGNTQSHGHGHAHGGPAASPTLSIGEPRASPSRKTDWVDPDSSRHFRRGCGG